MSSTSRLWLSVISLILLSISTLRFSICCLKRLFSSANSLTFSMADSFSSETLFALACNSSVFAWCIFSRLAISFLKLIFSFVIVSSFSRASLRNFSIVSSFSLRILTTLFSQPKFSSDISAWCRSSSFVSSSFLIFSKFAVTSLTPISWCWAISCSFSLVAFSFSNSWSWNSFSILLTNSFTSFSFSFIFSSCCFFCVLSASCSSFKVSFSFPIFSSRSVILWLSSSIFRWDCSLCSFIWPVKLWILLFNSAISEFLSLRDFSLEAALPLKSPRTFSNSSFHFSSISNFSSWSFWILFSCSSFKLETVFSWVFLLSEALWRLFSSARSNCSLYFWTSVWYFSLKFSNWVLYFWFNPANSSLSLFSFSAEAFNFSSNSLLIFSSSFFLLSTSLTATFSFSFSELKTFSSSSLLLLNAVSSSLIVTIAFCLTASISWSFSVFISRSCFSSSLE